MLHFAGYFTVQVEQSWRQSGPSVEGLTAGKMYLEEEEEEDIDVGEGWAEDLERLVEEVLGDVVIPGHRTMAPGGRAGVRHSHNQTDITGFTLVPGGYSLTLDQESTAVYASLTHRITAQLTASVLGQYQHSTYKGGSVNGQGDDFFIAGVNFNYKFDRDGRWQAEAGYNYDKLNSDLAFRGYHRNRLYLGVRATL